MKREEKLLKNTLILAIGTFFPKITALITLPILTGYLTTEDYGSYDLVLTLVSLILPAVTLQIQTAAFRFLIEVDNDEIKKRKIISSIFCFSFIASLIALSILFWSIPIESAYQKLVICSYFMIDMLLSTSKMIARGISRNFQYSISSVISSSFQAVLAIIFVIVFRLGLTGAVLAIMLADLIALIYLVFGTRIHSYFSISQCEAITIKELISYSWPMVPNNLGLWVMRLSDRLVVTAALGLSANGVYAVANKIPQLLSTAQSTFTMAWQESASFAVNDRDVSQYYSSTFKMMFRFYVGCLAVLVGLTPLLFKLLVRGEYDAAYYQMPILFFGVFFNCLTAFLGGIYVAFKKTRSVGVTTSLAAICNLTIDVLLVNKIGLYAASISTLASYVILFVYRLIDIKKIVNLKIDVIEVVALYIVLIAQAVFCYLRVPQFDIINLFVGVLLMLCLNKEIIKSVFYKICFRIR